MLRPFLLLLAWTVLWGAGVAPVQAQRLTVRQAFAVDSDAPQFPADVGQRPVALPDDWARSRPGQTTPVWYRVRFDAPAARDSGDLHGLYIERVCSNVDIWLNGTRVYAVGRMVEPVTSQCQHPQLIALPAAIVEPEGNRLDIKLVGHALETVASRQRAAGLSEVEFGPYAKLAERHGWQNALTVVVPQVASATLALLGVMMLAMGGLGRREGALTWFGLLALGWSAVTSRLWWRDVPLDHMWAEGVQVTLVGLTTFAAVQFLLRYAGRRPGPVTPWLALQTVLVPVSVAVAGPERMHATASAWNIVFALESFAAVAYHLAIGWRWKRGGTNAMGLLLAAACIFVGLEFVAQQRLLDPEVVALSQIAMPALFVAVGLRLMRDYGRALQAAEQGRRSLEDSIRDATAEIERNFAQLAELRVEQVTERERKRIAADLHDDLGAKLLTIVHTSESERISSLAREALEEMRLSVRGLTGKPVRLIDALGDWRAEVVSRLAQAGVEADWSAPTEDLPQTLSARAYVQTTRILREAVSNIIKHSGASHCTVRSTVAEGDFQLVIQDNGRGIPLELDGRLDRGHGMSSMKHRAKQLQGQCLVESGPGYGTVIRLTLPLEHQTAKA
jgi:two-component system sensor histidine kinase UhpB